MQEIGREIRSRSLKSVCVRAPHLDRTLEVAEMEWSLRFGAAASVVATGLDWRARHWAERAEHTTIARFWA